MSDNIRIPEELFSIDYLSCVDRMIVVSLLSLIKNDESAITTVRIIARRAAVTENRARQGIKLLKIAKLLDVIEHFNQDGAQIESEYLLTIPKGK